MKLLLSGM